MKVLGFERRCRIVHGHRLRETVFVPRSMLPVAAACLVANTVRETLAELLAKPVTLRLFEPVIPDSAAWSCIADGAEIFGVRGSLADAAFVLRRNDALAVAGAAFGELAPVARELSALENALLVRIVGALCGTLTPICGAREDARVDRLASLRGYVTYFELLLEEPIDARIGIAMSREPHSAAVPAIGVTDLAQIELELAVEVAHGFIPASTVLDLRRGEVVKLDSRLGDRAIVRAAERVVARGEYGELAGRGAVVLQ